MRRSLRSQILTPSQLTNFFKENPMNIPSTADLLNATDKDGWDLGDRIESSLGVILGNVLDPEQLDTLQLAHDLTENVLQDIVNYDLAAYAHQKES